MGCAPGSTGSSSTDLPDMPSIPSAPPSVYIRRRAALVTSCPGEQHNFSALLPFLRLCCFLPILCPDMAFENGSGRCVGDGRGTCDAVESLEALAERRGDRLPHPLASPDPATMLERQELYQRALAALAKLPPRARLVLDLRSRGMSFRDISRYLDISSSQAARIHRVALRKLRKELLSYVRAA